jgi:hypothetical protein
MQVYTSIKMERTAKWVVQHLGCRGWRKDSEFQTSIHNTAKPCLKKKKRKKEKVERKRAQHRVMGFVPAVSYLRWRLPVFPNDSLSPHSVKSQPPGGEAFFHLHIHLLVLPVEETKKKKDLPSERPTAMVVVRNYLMG